MRKLSNLLFALLLCAPLAAQEKKPFWKRFFGRKRPKVSVDSPLAPNERPTDWEKPDSLWIALFIQHGGSYGSQTQIKDFSKSGRSVPEIHRKDIRELIIANYRIIYRIEPKVIPILTVRHCRQILPDEDIDNA